MRVREGLPSGLVTFVLTDIEGSTRLLRHLGDRYPSLLDTHNSVLREQWVSYGGVEVNTAGDSFVVAFQSAGDALVACIAAQRVIADCRWPAESVVRIRIGVHTGIAFPRRDTYVALALHQAARVVGAANGGQVIASEDTIKAAAGDPRVRIEQLGAFRLRDFERPVQLSTVVAPGDRLDDLVRVRAIPADGHNLIAPVTSLVGRADDIGEVQTRLGPGRLISVVGAGGMGKTRLATEVGLRVAPAWPDGVWMVDLAAVGDGRLVASAVADAVGAPPGDGDEETAVVEQLERRAALIILDNCEHVLAASSRLAHRLLTRCAGVGILATSRIPLACPGEEIWRIEPLGLVDDSVELFIEHGRALIPKLHLGPDERHTVGEICRLVDGMPLGIELAAARLTVLSPTEILEGLRTNPRLLRANDPTAAQRHHSMQRLLDWSYGLLAPAEQVALARLSVFAGSFGVPVAGIVVGHGAVDSDDAAELIWSLADHSLVTVDRSAGATRYRLLETVRAYAAQKLDDAGDAAPTRARLALCYLARFPWADSTRRSSVSAFDLEVDSVAALVDPLFDDGRIDEALALSRLVATNRTVHDRFSLALEELEHAIERAGPPSVMLARAHAGAVLAAVAVGRLDRAEAHHREAAALVERFGPEDWWGHVSLARSEAEIAVRRGRPTDTLDRVRRLLEKELMEPLNPVDRADTLITLSLVMSEMGDPATIDVSREVVELARTLEDEGLLCNALSDLAEYDLRRGDSRAAATHQREALQLAAELGGGVATAFSFIVAARIAAGFGDLQTAVQLHAVADPMLGDAGFNLLPQDQALSDEMRSRAEDHLGPERYATLVQEGRDLSRLQAVELAEEVFDMATTAQD